MFQTHIGPASIHKVCAHVFNCKCARERDSDRNFYTTTTRKTNFGEDKKKQPRTEWNKTKSKWNGQRAEAEKEEKNEQDERTNERTRKKHDISNNTINSVLYVLNIHFMYLAFRIHYAAIHSSYA